MGGDLRGLGDGPPNFDVVDGPCILRFNTCILRSSVVGCARKYEQSKKGVIKELFSEIVVFLVKKGTYTTFNTVKILKIWKKKGKIRKTWSKVIRNFGGENGNFFEKPHSEILVREKFFRPPKHGATSPPMSKLMYIKPYSG